MYIDITIENVEPSTYETVRGDKVYFKITLHNRGGVGAGFQTVRALSGKKVLASKLADLDLWDVRDRMVVELTWDTSKSEQGKHQVRIELPMFIDADEFDNVFKLSKPITIG
jgi:hypothetical protein